MDKLVLGNVIIARRGSWRSTSNLRESRLIQFEEGEAPSWPTDPVIVVDARHASQSHIVSPQALPYIWRTKFSTLIRDVATTATRDPVFSIQITNAYLASESAF
jgi:hypothetical protein